MTERTEIYDFAVSFAEAQRSLVEQVVRASQALGLKVFYDKDSTLEVWGRNAITDGRPIFGGERARYVVAFLSKEYLASAYAMDEFRTAMRRAIETSEDSFLLPIVVEFFKMPSELLDPSIGYLCLENYTPDELAKFIADRVAPDLRQKPREVMGPTALPSPRAPAGRPRTLASMKPDPDSWEVVPLEAYGEKYSRAIVIDTADCNRLHPFIGAEMVYQAYDLGAASQYVKFAGTAGVARTSRAWNGSLQFRVYGDEGELARSVATKDEPATFDVDIRAIRTIKIVLMKGRAMGSCYDFTAAWLYASVT